MSIRFLMTGGQHFRIYIIEQSNDGRKFNRGKLLNVGYDIAKSHNCKIFIFHDVDLLPSENLIEDYTKEPSVESPVHIARLWPRYTNNMNYFGGIVSFTRNQFERINGFPNNFWGWGGEDDEMKKRIDEVRLLIEIQTTMYSDSSYCFFPISRLVLQLSRLLRRMGRFLIWKKCR